MGALKSGAFPVELNGKEYGLLFSLNALDEVQEKFGGYDKLSEVFNKDNPNLFMALCGLPVKKVWEKVREFLAKYTDELPDTDELDGDSTTGNVEEHRTQER